MGPAAAPADRLPERLAAHLDAYAALWSFHGAVAVAREGAVVLERAYGFADAALGVPNAVGTRFRIWSLTKRFTAAAVLLLAERGRLRLDDPLARFFPDAPGLDPRITLAHCLSHASGIPNYSALPDSRRVFQRVHHEPAELLALFAGWAPESEPGAAFRYSNTGYWFLGEVVARAADRPYADFLAREVLAPLGLADTGVDDGRSIVPGMASGHHLDGDGLIRCGYVDMDLVRASGGMYATAADLLRWDRALRDGRLLSAAAVARMETSGLGGYGLGVRVDSDRGRRHVHHGGGCEGFLAELHAYPDDDLSLAVLSNTGFANVGGLAHDLAALVFGEPVASPSRPAAVEWPEALVAERLGRYEAPGLRLEVRRQRPDPPGARGASGSALFEVVLEDAYRLPAYPVREDALHHAWTDEEYGFGRTEDGRPTLWGAPKVDGVDAGR